MPETRKPGTAAVRTEFIERIGLIAQGEGLPRIAGRLFALLMFDGDDKPFGGLADALQVSRGSISSSVRLLEERGLVKRVAHPGDRQDYFRVSDAPFANLLAGARRRTDHAATEIEDSLSSLPAGASEVRDRLSAYAGFYRAIGDGLDRAHQTISPSDDENGPT